MLLPHLWHWLLPDFGDTGETWLGAVCIAFSAAPGLPLVCSKHVGLECLLSVRKNMIIVSGFFL